MEFKSFDDLNITTVTRIAMFSGFIDHKLAFLFMPVLNHSHEAYLVKPSRKLPHLDPGTIISIRDFPSRYRGVDRERSSLKNSITLDMSYSRKNASIKISKNSIHMTGLRDENDSDEIVMTIMKYLMDISKLFQAKNKIPIERRKEIIDYIYGLSAGAKIHYTTSDHAKIKGINVEFLNTHVANKVNVIDINLIKMDFNPEETAIIKFLLSFTGEYNYRRFIHQVYMDLVNIFFEKDDILFDVKYIDTETCMVNYNFNLGCKINRHILAQMIDGRKGFMARYNNSLTYHATIDLPYEQIEETLTKKKKSKIPHQTIIIYQTGSVTLSCKDLESANYTYNLLVESLKEIEPYIIVKDKAKTE